MVVPSLIIASEAVTIGHKLGSAANPARTPGFDGGSFLYYLSAMKG